MYAEIVDVWRDVGTLCLASELNLLHAEKRCRQRLDRILFKKLASFEARPSAGYCDTDPLPLKMWADP